MAYSREVMNFQGERVQALGQQDASGWKGTRQRRVFGYSYASNHPCYNIQKPQGGRKWSTWPPWLRTMAAMAVSHMILVFPLPDPFGSAMNLMIWDGILVLACFSAECQMCQMCQVAQTSATFFFWCKGWHRATWQRFIMFHRVWSLDVTCSTESQFQPIT